MRTRIDNDACTHHNERMDIKKLLQELFGLGLSDAEIARKLSEDGHQVSQSVINRLRRGVHGYTFYERHQAIINLHKKIVLLKKSEEAA